MKLSSDGRLLLVELEEAYRFISTLPPGQGVSQVYAFIRVPETYRIPSESLAEALAVEARNAGLDPETPVFLTAASLDDYISIVREDYGVVATVGLTPPTCPGGGGMVSEPIPATINILVVSRRPITPSAALDLLRVAAEAKAAAAWELLLRCPGVPPWRPVGTVSDAIMVAWREGPGPAVAGHNTSLGAGVGLAVYEGLVRAGSRVGLWYVKRALGVGLEDLARLVAALYEQAPVPGVSVDSVFGEARRILEGWLRDPNVASFIIAARELDVRAASGALPGLGLEEYASDSVRILADDIMGLALAEYLAGKRAVFTLIWAERLKKEGLLPEYEPFTDDIVMALVSSALTVILDRLLSGVGK